MSQALVVIDVQHALFNPAPRPFEADAVVQRINALSARARAAGVPVLWVQHEAPDSPLERGAPGWQLQAGLQVADSDRWVHKRTADAFCRTDLAEQLQALGVRELVVAGYASEFCVDTTVRRAAALGYAVTLAADAHTTHDKAHAGGGWIRTHHNTTLADISSFGVPITAQACAQLRFAGEAA